MGHIITYKFASENPFDINNNYATAFELHAIILLLLKHEAHYIIM